MIRALASMMAASVLCLLSIPLAGCVVDANLSSARSPVDRAGDAYARVRLAAVLALPFLPPATAQRVRTGLALADAALAAARSNATPEDRLVALGKLVDATTTIVASTASQR